MSKASTQNKTRKRAIRKHKESHRKEIIKIRTKINEIDHKET